MIDVDTPTKYPVGTVLRKTSTTSPYDGCGDYPRDTVCVVFESNDWEYGTRLTQVPIRRDVPDSGWLRNAAVREHFTVVDPAPYCLVAGYVWTRDLDPELRADARWTCGRYAVENYANEGYVDGDSWMVIPNEDGEWFDTRDAAMTHVAALIDSALPHRVPT